MIDPSFAPVQLTLFITGGPNTSSAGGLLIVAGVPAEIHPSEFLAVIVYVPADKPENTPVVFVYDEPLIL